MFIVILIAAFGVAVGYLLRRFSWVQHANQGIHVTICFMLFVLGISVGENPLIVKNLWRFGGSGFADWICQHIGQCHCGCADLPLSVYG